MPIIIILAEIIKIILGITTIMVITIKNHLIIKKEII
jgi:hypothetical protein